MNAIISLLEIPCGYFTARQEIADSVYLDLILPATVFFLTAIGVSMVTEDAFLHSILIEGTLEEAVDFMIVGLRVLLLWMLTRSKTHRGKLRVLPRDSTSQISDTSGYAYGVG